MTQTRGGFPELYSNYKKPGKVKPLPIPKPAAPAKPKKKGK